MQEVYGMNNFFTEPIRLSREESEQFIQNWLRPDREHIKKRDEVLDEIDNDITLTIEGSNMVIESTALDLSFIDDIDKKDEYEDHLRKLLLEKIEALLQENTYNPSVREDKTNFDVNFSEAA